MARRAKAEENNGKQIDGILWNAALWIKRNPWAFSFITASISGIVAWGGFGKDPRNGLVYVYKPVISAIQDSVKASEDRQIVAVRNLTEVLQEMKDYDSAQARVDRRRAEEAARRLRQDRILKRSPVTRLDTVSPIDAQNGFTAEVLAGKGPLFRRTN